MRVLYLSDSYGPHDHRFLAAAAGAGLEVFFLRRRSGPGTEGRPVPSGVQCLPALEAHSEPCRRLGLRSTRALRQVLLDQAIDLVHAGPVQDCAWLAAAAGFPALLTVSWGCDLLRRARFGLGKWLASATLRRSSGFLGDCRAVLDCACSLGLDPSQATVFPWGVDLELFSPGGSSSMRRELGWESNFVAICARAWEPGYGVETIVEAFARAAAHRQDLRLILAGDGSLRSRVLQSVEAQGLESRVWLPGHIAYGDLPRFYRAADLYLSASECDGSSVSLLEAMACGLPALVSDIPGNREWVEAEGTGWFFGTGEAERLADRLLHAASRRRELRPMGSRAREIAEARADWSLHRSRLLEAYDAALMRWGGRR